MAKEQFSSLQELHRLSGLSLLKNAIHVEGKL